MSVDTKMLMLRTQLYTAMQTLEGDKLKEFWDLLEEVQVAGGGVPVRRVEVIREARVAQVPLEGFMSEDGKTLYF